MKVIDLLLYVMYKAQFGRVSDDDEIFGAKCCLAIALSNCFYLVANELLILIGVPALILKGHAYMAVVVLGLSVIIVFGVYRKRALSFDKSRAIMQRFKLNKWLICFAIAMFLTLCPPILLALHYEALGVYK